MDTSAAAPRQPRKRWGAALSRIVRERVLSRLDRRRQVMRWQPSAVRIGTASLIPQRIETLSALPPAATREADSSAMPRDWYRHFFAQGAALWTAFENGRALGSLWIIGAQHLGGWYVPLEPEARVIYGVVTPGWARGRGVAPQLALAAARDAGDAPVYLDCMVWNRAAQRAFGKAGFVPLATVGSRWRGVRADPDA